MGNHIISMLVFCTVSSAHCKAGTISAEERKSTAFSLEKLAGAAEVPRNQFTFTNAQQMYPLAEDFCSQ